MTESSYRIYPDWKDTLVYDDGAGQALRFDCDGVEPYQVSVPTAPLWPHKTPPWAHDRRELILDRLRAARCIICEVSLTTTSIFAPDGTCRVEIYFERDERGYVMRAIRLFAMPGDAKLIDLDDASPAGTITFPQPGIVTLPFTLGSRRYQIGVNVSDRTFWFHPTEEPRPLDQLLPSLAAQPSMVRPMQQPAQPQQFVARPGLRTVLGTSSLFLISLLFVAGGIFECIAGRTSHDRAIGALCVIFFGIGALVWMNDLRRWLENRNR